jgi:hypothetical protein
MHEQSFRAGMRRVAFYAGRLERLAAELRRELELFDANPSGTGIGDLRHLPRRVKDAHEALQAVIDEAREAGVNVGGVDQRNESGTAVARCARYRRVKPRRVMARRGRQRA